MLDFKQRYGLPPSVLDDGGLAVAPFDMAAAKMAARNHEIFGSGKSQM